MNGNGLKRKNPYDTISLYWEYKTNGDKDNERVQPY